MIVASITYIFCDKHNIASTGGWTAGLLGSQLRSDDVETHAVRGPTGPCSQVRTVGCYFTGLTCQCMYTWLMAFNRVL